MRKLTGKCRWMLAVFLAAVCMATGCNTAQTTQTEADGAKDTDHKISVVATVFPYYDFARAIGGDYLDVTLLLPPGRDSHSFEPTAQDLLTLQSADVFLYNGGEMETWVEEVLDAVPRDKGIIFQGIETVNLLEEAHTKSMKTIGHSHDHDHDDHDHDDAEEATHDDHDHDDAEEETHDDHDHDDAEEATHDDAEEATYDDHETEADDHDHDESDHDHNKSDDHDESDHDHNESDDHDEYDEHIWTSLENAQILVSAIEEVLCEADPAHATAFHENAADYREQIAQVQSEIQEIVDSARVKKILFADRFPFLYFTEEFGLDYDAAFAGCAGDTEPSARVIASLIEEVQKEDIKAIYHVEMGNTKTAEMIQEITGVEILELHSCHTVTSEQLKEGVTYVDLMRQNAENLKKGLQ